MILNRADDAEKGINKTLKLVSTCSVDSEMVSQFLIKYFPVGMLTARNLTSLFKFLAKMASSQSYTLMQR